MCIHQAQNDDEDVKSLDEDEVGGVGEASHSSSQSSESVIDDSEAWIRGSWLTLYDISNNDKYFLQNFKYTFIEQDVYKRQRQKLAHYG